MVEHFFGMVFGRDIGARSAEYDPAALVDHQSPVGHVGQSGGRIAGSGTSGDVENVPQVDLAHHSSKTHIDPARERIG
ncbi:hypothetical protein [Nocardia beijingensis]|uniref:hypothetical protein n=1 Tax=Nocardia beijingensis TaxID=95162 RepID=UPI001FD0C0B6|nr:hypothetical protein [Nocardia beijingensis]